MALVEDEAKVMADLGKITEEVILDHRTVSSPLPLLLMVIHRHPGNHSKAVAPVYQLQVHLINKTITQK